MDNVGPSSIVSRYSLEGREWELTMVFGNVRDIGVIVQSFVLWNFVLVPVYMDDFEDFSSLVLEDVVSRFLGHSCNPFRFHEDSERLIIGLGVSVHPLGGVVRRIG